MKKERVERQVAEDKLVTAISELKHDAISMDFDREKKKIWVDAGDKEAWGRSNQDQRMEMIRATVNECFDNVSLRDKINIWITRPRRGNFLPQARLSFPSAELKYTYEKIVKEKRNKISSLPGRQKYFLTQRLVPPNSLPTKAENDQTRKNQNGSRLGNLGNVSGKLLKEEMDRIQRPAMPPGDT